MRESVGAIVVAAGSSTRMAGLDKLWLDIGGQPLLARTLGAMLATPGLDQLVVVGSSTTLERARGMAGVEPWSRVDRWVPGGATRQDSVYCGLQALAPCDLVLVHDGARPLISAEALARGIVAARDLGAVIAAVPVTDTIKTVDEEAMITGTLERSNLRAAQTPQIFAWERIVRAYADAGAARAGCTDDAGVLQLAGIPVYTFLGEPTNLKVSTPADVAIVRALWAVGHEGA